MLFCIFCPGLLGFLPVFELERINIVVARCARQELADAAQILLYELFLGVFVITAKQRVTEACR